MKKNWTMRVGVALLALTLVTSCFVGGTFAKYITKGSGADSARVAKWGVTVSATGDMFSEEYDKLDNSYTLGTKTVISTEKVVAPGTDGSLGSTDISGIPEVAGRITRSATVTLNDSWLDQNGTFYFPLVIKVNNAIVNLSTATSATDVQTAIEDAIEDCTVDFEPNQDLSDPTFAATADCSITWEWPFESGADAEAKNATDLRDTALGDNAAAGNPGTIAISVDTVVTQLD